MDLYMPEKDGLETIVAMSGGGSTGQVDILNDARLLGAVETLEKPFSSQALLDLIARLLAGEKRSIS